MIREIETRGVRTEIIHHTYMDAPVKTFLARLPAARECLSTREGFKTVSVVGNHYNPSSIWTGIDSETGAWETLRDLGLDPARTAMLYTAEDVDNLGVAREEYGDYVVYAFSTAGVGRDANAMRVGVEEALWVEGEDGFERVGTINTIILSNAGFTRAAMTRGVITATEAKVIALQDLDVRSSYDPGLQATGTGTDNLILVPGEGPRVDYVGGHGKMGEILARAVTASVKEAVLNSR